MKKEITFAGLRLPQPAPVSRSAFVLAFGVQPEEMFGHPTLAEANLKAQFEAEQRAIHETD